MRVKVGVSNRKQKRKRERERERERLGKDFKTNKELKKNRNAEDVNKKGNFCIIF